MMVHLIEEVEDNKYLDLIEHMELNLQILELDLDLDHNHLIIRKILV